MNPKRGFVFYFDNYPTLTALPPEQRGWLLTVLMVYADRVWREPEVNLEEVMEGFPMLSPETRLACGFMGTNILRDTRKWLSRQQRGSARPQRGASAGPAPGNTERTRRLLERMKQEQDA